jgi:thiol-disulfide isomerase/thioredoxin
MQNLLKATLLALVPLFSVAAFAAEVPFNQGQFDAALASGKPVAVVFHADWCPTCRAQAPLLKELAQGPDLKALTLFVADFDTAHALEKSLGVTKQSTIVVFKTGKEIARSTGDTQRDNLATLLHRAIS